MFIILIMTIFIPSFKTYQAPPARGPSRRACWGGRSGPRHQSVFQTPFSCPALWPSWPHLSFGQFTFSVCHILCSRGLTRCLAMLALNRPSVNVNRRAGADACSKLKSALRTDKGRRRHRGNGTRQPDNSVSRSDLCGHSSDPRTTKNNTMFTLRTRK